MIHCCHINKSYNYRFREGQKIYLIFLSFTKYKSNGYNWIEVVVKVNILI